MSWLLIAVLCASLLLIPLGLPGLWVMTGVAAVAWLMQYIALSTMLSILAIVIVAELIEFAIVGKLTKQYGGTRKAFWGAILGGGIGVFVGAPVPVIGSIVAGFVGSFIGAAIVTFAETREAGPAGRVGTGAVIGRALTAVAKTAAGLAVLVITAAAIMN